MNQRSYNSPESIAELLGVQEATVRRWIESGAMQVVVSDASMREFVTKFPMLFDRKGADENWLNSIGIKPEKQPPPKRLCAQCDKEREPGQKKYCLECSADNERQYEQYRNARLQNDAPVEVPEHVREVRREYDRLMARGKFRDAEAAMASFYGNMAPEVTHANR